jgi:hypothetical protein
MNKVTSFISDYRAFITLLVVVFLLTFIPLFDIHFILGNEWRGIFPNFTDELNFARLEKIGQGYLTDGNAYYYEHRFDAPIVIFGGTWLNAIPLWLGVSFNETLILNFIIWSLLFALLAYYLFRLLRASPWLAVSSSVFLYLASYEHVWRPGNLQPVYPFYLFFYTTIIRFLRDQNRRNVILLALATGCSFYVFSYLWQVAVVTLGVLFLYAVVRKNKPLIKATAISGACGVALGLPILIYTLWLSHASPYFWQTMGRFGLVHTHIPTSEIFYSGGWIGIVLIFLAFLLWQVRSLRHDSEFTFIVVFSTITGLGLWITEASNFITGLWDETGEHVRILILPWIVWSTVVVGFLLWKRRAALSRPMRVFCTAMLVLLVGANVYFGYLSFSSFLPSHIDRTAWETEQRYAGPYSWLNENVKNPSVIWSDPHDAFTTNLPVFTKHYTLQALWGELYLMSDQEAYERFLVSQYFNNPTVADLENYSNMALYLGRADLAHNAATIDRSIKICRIVFFWNKNKNCGTELTSQQLLGNQFFQDLENKFQNDIRPNIKAYLAKYHVSYIAKDKVLDPNYHPQTLGATLVYSDDRYEIWHL